MLPGILYFVIFKYLPMSGVTIAFLDYNIFKGMSASPWVGLKYFNFIFSEYGFKQAFYNTVIISLSKFIFGFPVPIILSLMINEIFSGPFKKVVQTTVILPNFLSWVVIYGLFYAIFSPSTGMIRDLTDLIGYTGALPNLLGDSHTIVGVLVGTAIWNGAGMGTIVYLAAISSISHEIYESSVIDGASRWQQMLHITLPSLKSTIIVLMFLRLGVIVYAGFDQVFVFSNPLVQSSIDILDTYVYRMGLQNSQFSLATAAGLFQSGIGLILVLVTNFIIRKVDPENAFI